VLKRLKEIRCSLSVAPVGPGPTKIVEEDNQIYNTAVSVNPEFPGGMAKFYKYVGDNYRAPEEEGLRGKVYIVLVKRWFIN
jgi:protein TonB